MRALQKADPANAGRYASNAVAYVERLHKLDREIAEALARYKGAPIVTYHDAFPYFAQRYGLEVVGVIEPVPDVDPTPRELSDLRKRMRERNVRVVFVEKDSSSRLAERMRDDLRVKLAPLDPLESGDLSAEAYENGMRRNLETLKKAFDASVP
jgi:zinc/manganese transport system substrate-binding protein